MAKEDDTYKNPDESPVLPNKFDSRIRLRSLTRGVLTHKEIKAYHDALPDDTDKADFRDYDQLVHQEGHEVPVSVETNGVRGGGGGTTTH